jgi:hypothetical protein
VLPKKINLGCGHVVKVDLVPRSTITTLLGHETEACWMHDTPDGTSFLGVIFVDRSLSQAQQKEALYHELLHACVDLFQTVVDGGR